MAVGVGVRDLDGNPVAWRAMRPDQPQAEP